MEESYTTWGEGSLSPFFTRWKIHPRWLFGISSIKSTKKNILWTWTAMSVYYIISILPSPWSWWSYQLRLPAILDFRKKHFTKYAESMEYLPGSTFGPYIKSMANNVGEYSIHAALMWVYQTPTYVALQRIKWECCRRRHEFSQVSA